MPAAKKPRLYFHPNLQVAPIPEGGGAVPKSFMFAADSPVDDWLHEKTGRSELARSAS